VALCLLALLAAPANAATAEMHIVGGAPNPAEITVDEGDSVMFFNDDDVEHTIFADGQPYGDPIRPHGNELFGPFETSGQGGTFAYQVDAGGASGTVIVRGPAATSSSTTATSAPPRTTTTSTTVPATTEATATTATTLAGIDSSTAVAAGPKSGKKDSSNVLTVIGFALLAAGVGGLVIAMERSRRRRAR
jgi:plastocyanin